MNLKDKRVLITAGPTWIPIDSVRVISNVATGLTGVLLADKFLQRGFKVTLLLGPGEKPSLNKRIKLIRFRFFEEFKKILFKELRTGGYGIVVHTAAVADYRPQRRYPRKVTSNKQDWLLKLVPTPKIIDAIKRISKNLFLVGFKFELDAGKDKLIKAGRMLMHRSHANLVVANTVRNHRYSAFIVDTHTCYGHFSDKEKMCSTLIKIVGDKLWKS
ncbi:MAG: phosphopantothenoylcysteine decarboxylase [Candidatus Omnitrophica bacterium]|nr:phosphopantothenoylcysteine decarboxylase [Candidatus Omnitrophota bacterium]